MGKEKSMGRMERKQSSLVSGRVERGMDSEQSIVMGMHCTRENGRME